MTELNHILDAYEALLAERNCLEKRAEQAEKTLNILLDKLAREEK